MSPRVTVGITTFNRERFLEEAVRSVLAQTFQDFEILVVDDGSSDGTADLAEQLVAGRGRVLRHGTNRGVCAAHDTLMAEMQGELLAWLDDDDAAYPDWLERSVAILDAEPGVGVTHGDALVVNAAGSPQGTWRWQPWAPLVSAGPLAPVVRRDHAATRGRLPLVRQLVRDANHVIAPGTVTRRTICEAVGRHDPAVPRAHDMDWWLRALDHCELRHVPGGPLVRYRRHDDQASGAQNRAEELRDVEAVLRRALARHPLRDLVPELDWGALDPSYAERRALETLAADLDRRGLATFAGELRDEAATRSARQRQAERPAGTPSRLVLTSFGFNDAGGGTRVPRVLAKELVRRGWEVTVFHAAIGDDPRSQPLARRTWTEDGVDLVGVFNRPSAMLDVGHPDRDVEVPTVAAAFGELLDQARPDAVHFHNLHNLGAALVDEAFARGIGTLYSTHNHWLVCPRAFLFREPGLTLCSGPSDEGRDCAACVGSRDTAAHVSRRAEIRRRFNERVDTVLAVSDAVRRTLVGSGFDEDLVEVVEQAMPEPERIWDAVGRDRLPGRVGGPLRVGFLGSLYPHKGPDLLVQAAQLVAAPIEVHLHGDVSDAFRAHLVALDTRGVVRIAGGFAADEIATLLASIDVAVVPSATWDCAPLVVPECLAARVPVIAARMGGVAEGIRDGIDGLAFDGRDVAGLAASLERVAADDGLLERLQAGILPPRSFARFVDDLERRYTSRKCTNRSVHLHDDPQTRSTPGVAEIAVRWTGDQSVSSSLALINRSVASRLAAMDGIRVERHAPREGPLDAPLAHPADVEVRHTWPPDFTDPGASRLVLIQPWEFGSVPRDWIAPLAREIDELWVPSAFVRAMYVRDGVPGERVVVVGNGVDLDRFRPDGARRSFPREVATRFLFVGGTIYRKGVDVLIDAWREAFAGRDDVELVVKDLGAGTFYRGKTAGSRLAELAASGELPRIVYLDDDLTDDQLPELYRASDVLVHPYRGEGFALPVLEAMACGLPVIVTAGGPTDEFCPSAAGWQIEATRRAVEHERIQLTTVQEPWMLEPDRASLVACLRAALDPAERARRGAAARVAAEDHGWDAVAAAYAERLRLVASRPPVRHRPDVSEPFAIPGARSRNLLATPAWKGDDALADLLVAWCSAFGAGDDVALVLLADPVDCDDDDALSTRVLHAAASRGLELDDAVADIVVLRHRASADDLARIHAACDGYVPLHAACAGNRRIAALLGRPVLEPTAAGLRAWAAERIAA